MVPCLERLTPFKINRKGRRVRHLSLKSSISRPAKVRNFWLPKLKVVTPIGKLRDLPPKPLQRCVCLKSLGLDTRWVMFRKLWKLMICPIPLKSSISRPAKVRNFWLPKLKVVTPIGKLRDLPTLLRERCLER
jgi:hypothetical protein